MTGWRALNRRGPDLTRTAVPRDVDYHRARRGTAEAWRDQVECKQRAVRSTLRVGAATIWCADSRRSDELDQRRRRPVRRCWLRQPDGPGVRRSPRGSRSPHVLDQATHQRTIGCGQLATNGPGHPRPAPVQHSASLRRCPPCGMTPKACCRTNGFCRTSAPPCWFGVLSLRLGG